MSLVPRHFSKGYAHALTDAPPKVPVGEIRKAAIKWAKAHPSPFRRKPRNQRTKT